MLKDSHYEEEINHVHADDQEEKRLSQTTNRISGISTVSGVSLLVSAKLTSVALRSVVVPIGGRVAHRTVV